MTSAYPAIGDCAVTAAAMRAAAGDHRGIGPGRGCRSPAPARRSPSRSAEASGDPAERAAQVGRLARIAGSHAYRDDSRVTAYAQVKAYGQARGIPVSIFTPLQVRTRPGSTGPVPLACGPGGQVTVIPGGKLPARVAVGHRARP